MKVGPRAAHFGRPSESTSGIQRTCHPECGGSLLKDGLVSIIHLRVARNST